MSDVIDFLERMGQDAKWSYASSEDIGMALTDAEIAPELHASIVGRDQEGLQLLLGITPICAMYLPGKEDEKEDEDTEEVPPGEEDDKPEHSLSRLQTSAG